MQAKPSVPILVRISARLVLYCGIVTTLLIIGILLYILTALFLGGALLLVGAPTKSEYLQVGYYILKLILIMIEGISFIYVSFGIYNLKKRALYLFSFLTVTFLFLINTHNLAELSILKIIGTILFLPLTYFWAISKNFSL